MVIDLSVAFYDVAKLTLVTQSNKKVPIGFVSLPTLGLKVVISHTMNSR